MPKQMLVGAKVDSDIHKKWMDYCEKKKVKSSQVIKNFVYSEIGEKLPEKKLKPKKEKKVRIKKERKIKIKKAVKKEQKFESPIPAQ